MIDQVLMTDSFAEWVAKTNLMIAAVNGLAIQGSVVSVSSPQLGQLLVWDGSFFQNVAMSGDATIDQNGVISVGTTAGGVSKGRLMYASSIRGVF